MQLHASFHIHYTLSPTVHTITLESKYYSLALYLAPTCCDNQTVWLTPQFPISSFNHSGDADIVCCVRNKTSNVCCLLICDGLSVCCIRYKVVLHRNALKAGPVMCPVQIDGSVGRARISNDRAIGSGWEQRRRNEEVLYIRQKVKNKVTVIFHHHHIQVYIQSTSIVQIYSYSGYNNTA